MVNKKSLATFVRTVGNQVIAGFKHFLNNVKIGGDLIISPDSLGNPATNVLTVDGNGVVKTATAFSGISVDSVSKVKHEVKAGVAINKGQAVYVTGADGTNMIVGLASNASESTSTKTMGLSESTLAINGKGNVVTEGLLDGLNTTAATIGDPVWLGTGGNLIYGLANKPYAPAHLVFIGIVTRVNASNGEIFVKVQNGFELNEIHDVDLKTNVPVNGEILGFNGTLWVNKTIAGWLGYTPANASGTTNYVSKFTGTTTLGDSQIFDNGTNVGIGTTTLIQKFHVNGNIVLGDVLYLNSANGAIWNSANGALRFGTNATERARFDAAGNFGIGTTSPGSKLTVIGDIATSTRVASDTINGYTGGSTPLTIQTGGAQNLIIGTNNTERIRVTAAGNVGIGTTSPLQLLHVAGLAYFGSDIFGAVNNGIFFSGNNSYNAGIYGRNSGSDLVLQGGGSERMRIVSSGNVGIGTTSPTVALDVNGTINGGFLTINRAETSAIFTDTRTNIHTTTPSFKVQNTGDTSVTTLSHRLVDLDYAGDADTVTGTYVRFLTGGTERAGLGLTSDKFTITTGVAERLTIDSTGNVGIGTTSPSYKLDVNGTGRFSGRLYADSNITLSGFIQPSSNVGYGVKSLNGTILQEWYDGAIYNYGTSYFAGNVGIGTTSPAFKLDINGASNSSPFRVLSTNTTSLRTFFEATSGNVEQHFLYTGNQDWVLGLDKADSNKFKLASADDGFASAKLTVTTSGNVGIGTTSPATRLHVDASGHALVVSNDTGNRRIYFGTGTLGEPDIQAALSNGTARELSINAAGGNVGIGVVSPTQKLHVSGNIRVTGAYYDSSNSAGSSGQVLSSTGSGTDWVSLSEITGVDGTGTANYVAKWSDADTIANSQIFDNGTNVGIGTATPTNKFQIGSISGYNGNAFAIGNGTDQFAIFQASSFTQFYTNGGFLFATGNTESVRITSTGNVGIGTTSPGYKLEVSGTVYINGDGDLLFDGSTGGDGFQMDYYNGQMYLGNKLGTSWHMVMKDNGNVGIGTTSPDSKLHISTTSSNPFRMVRTGGAATNFGYEFGNGAIGLYDYTNSSYRYYITSGGNVGIGTTSPNGKLEIVANPTGNTVLLGRTGGTSSIKALSDNGGYLALDSTGGATIINHYVSDNVWLVTGGGNVGIGTTSPASKLDVNGTISVAGFPVISNSGNYNRIHRPNGTVGIYLGNATDAGNYYDNSTHYFRSSGGGSTYAVISAAGNVGIGTTSPVERLSLSGATGTTLGLSIEPTGWNGAKHRLTVPTSGDASVWSFNYNGSVVDSALYGTSSIQINQGIVRFSTGATNTAPSEKMRIDSSGNVGIGTVNPGAKLDVVGSAGIRVNEDGIGTKVISIRSNFAGVDPAINVITNNALLLQTNNTERMRIDSSGNVGIGTTSPGARLDVSGIARATSLSTVSGLGLNVAGYAYLSQTISGAMTLLGHNVRASDSVANTAIVQNAGWISSLIKMYYNEGITFHTDSTVYAAGATYPLATTERMRIQVNGNVGIGTASPWSRFTVSGALSASTSQISIVNTEGGHSIIRAGISGVTNNGMSFVTANVDGSSQNVRMVVGATGNVGIGTTSTTSKLHVLLNGNTSGGPTGNVASFQNSSVGSNAYVTLFGAYNAEAGIVFTDESEQFKGKIGYNNNSEYMYFQTDGSEKVRITAAGNVGIGTTSPAASLHIGANGGVIFGATAGAVGTAQITTTSATSPVSTRFAFGTDGTGWQYRIAKNTAGTIIDLVTVADNGRVGIGTTSPSTLLHVEGRIYAGDIGIATTSPTQKLHVVGNARITGAIFDSLNSSGTAGQVLSSTGTGTEWVTGGGGGGSTIIVKDEGTTVGSSFTTLDFYGSNIQASASGSTAVITALNNAGTGSVYSNDTTAQYAPTASFADVEINTVTVEAAAPDTAGTGQKLIATITFGVDNVSDFDGFNNFDFRLYNSSASSAIADTTHSWCSYMSKGEFEKRTVFTFHIPLYDGVGGSDVVTVQAKQSTAYTPEIYYCALTLIEGTN